MPPHWRKRYASTARAILHFVPEADGYRGALSERRIDLDIGSFSGRDAEVQVILPKVRSHPAHHFNHSVDAFDRCRTPAHG